MNPNPFGENETIVFRGCAIFWGDQKLTSEFVNYDWEKKCGTSVYRLYLCLFFQQTQTKSKYTVYQNMCIFVIM